MNILEQQSMLFVETADTLARMARETLVNARYSKICFICKNYDFMNVWKMEEVTVSNSFAVQMSRKSYCTTPGVGMGSSVSISKMFKFYI